MLDLNFQDEYVTTEQIPTSNHKIDEYELLQKHQIIVKRIVNQLRVHATTHCGIEDMQQIGLMALIEAGRRYGDIQDPNFPAFAVCRIRGAILDELRRLDWRSRKTRQEAHELNDVTRDLTRTLGRPPTDAEIIKALGTDEQDYYARQNAALAGEMQSLDQLLEMNSHAQFGGDYDGMEHEHTRRSLESAIQQLTKRDQLILTLFYQHELNLHEIALVLNLTPPRICQLHKQALKQLNHYLTS
ncbi:FliA/WhiG family RNA polymerase sigma factor [Vibrio sp. V27_P1S3P104]|uniref:FliA/WhiG family RNA polymerase sigma factor n=1 Tax=unclassified Vibrio TaxID=2614977 RepID=UPI0013733FE0|nr:MULTISPECIES: FliA/WhiG family RNA polymerase sigma factor [unclassified Vibrio]NAW70636.1 FliA/WhiG family RNA polymerase sigma factor [Vibrio sp. V28_P6S34P95]NAX05095.1 FliA/WhiG family RNA polymerase sigma factor [Vibrio sp. V30_P3S12P165]NAX35552.1 FliA/WhiG family RNA polymerase sigma factor [Vibrio sp. V29_P1S30P107]NAX38927.1 FliA/WhiG family RNA polymerase sigma factor [Vibrio sp. V27_P1S3P104]NAX40095.1 FliA/WhiG family RNA polymerase sigma factor [Vibrio sp. V26_P1S5P106]